MALRSNGRYSLRADAVEIDLDEIVGTAANRAPAAGDNATSVPSPSPSPSSPSAAATATAAAPPKLSTAASSCALPALPGPVIAAQGLDYFIATSEQSCLRRLCQRKQQSAGGAEHPARGKQILFNVSTIFGTEGEVRSSPSGPVPRRLAPPFSNLLLVTRPKPTPPHLFSPPHPSFLDRGA